MSIKAENIGKKARLVIRKPTISYTIAFRHEISMCKGELRSEPEICHYIINI